MNKLNFEIIVKRSINLFENDEIFEDFHSGYYDKNLTMLMFEKGAEVVIVRSEKTGFIKYSVTIMHEKNFKLKDVIKKKILGTNKN